MHFPSNPPGHATPRSDAEIDAAVHTFMTQLTGTDQPAAAVARRYERATETIAEEVTELLATMAHHR